MRFFKTIVDIFADFLLFMQFCVEIKGDNMMIEPEKKEGPLYINRRAATVVLTKSGESFREEGKIMSGSTEIAKLLTPAAPPKDEKAGTADKPLQNPTPAMSPDSTAAGIDKIRDLIFGNQMQDYEKRFSRLEERMFKEMNVSKSESRKNFDSLEKFVHKEIESLKDRVAAEQNARSEAFRDISRQLKDLSRSLEKKVDNLNEQFSESETDLRHQVSELSQSLRNEIRQKYDEISSVIERVAQELQVNKLDRSSFSEFLTEMAMRVSNRIEN
jgi:hypothetical protein